MHYQGGKAYSGISRRIAAAILEAERTDRIGRYLEPFVGSAAIAERLAPHCDVMSLGDSRADMVILWREARAGWDPPPSMSRAWYEHLRHAEPSPERAFAGAAMSFGGKWFGGYSPPRPPNDFARAGRNSILRAGRALAQCPRIYWHPGACFFDYATPPPGTVVYLDPPYSGTTGYGSTFDHDRFWKVCREWSEAGAHLYVSEYEAPAGWVSIWTAEKRSTLSKSENRRIAVEHLFAYLG